MSMGVNARDLSDDDLRRELAHLKEKAADIESDGTSDQQANHRRRTDELEAEFLRRFLPESQGATGSTSAGSAAPDSTAAADAGGPVDASPAGPNQGPVEQQPQGEAESGHAESGHAETGQPSDAPTDDPERPANPA